MSVFNCVWYYTDFQDGFQTYRALQDEPTLISALVQISALSLVCNAAGDGLRDHAWTEPELRKLEADMASVRVWQDYRRAFSSERGFGNWCGDLLVGPSSGERTNMVSGLGATSPNYPGIPLVFVPRRIFRDNQLRENQNFDELVARASEDGSRFDPDGPNPSSAENLNGLFEPYYYFLFRLSAPVFSEVGNRFVQLQTQLDELRLACALERFWLVHGAFPEKLTELVPDFIAGLPEDTFSRRQLIYRRQDGGTFLLYGVGKNRVDDGGGIDPKLGERKQPDDVWLYAPPPK